MKKTEIPENISLEKALKGIREGIYYKSLLGDNQKLRYGLEEMTVDISAAEFGINRRWELQRVEIPSNKRGNLKKFAGKKVDVICTTISRGGPRINFYIKEVKNG